MPLFDTTESAADVNQAKYLGITPILSRSSKLKKWKRQAEMDKNSLKTTHDKQKYG